ncbi:hypothetical protein Tco_1556171 [Tanacetum coccineum]
MEELREFTLGITSIRLQRCSSAGCECEYSGFPRGEVQFVPRLLSFILDKRMIWYVFQARPGAFAVIYEKLDAAKAWREIVLLELVHLCKPKLVPKGVPPLRDGEEPRLESMAGAQWKWLEQPETQQALVLQRMLCRSQGESEVEKSTSGRRGNPRCATPLAANEVTETPLPISKGNLASIVEATSDSSAPVTHAVQSPPQTSPLTADDISRRDRETAAAGLGRSLRQVSAESSRSYAQKLAEEKMALLVKVEQERANSADYKASCHWAVKYLEGGKNNHFAGLDEFRQRVEELLEKQEGEGGSKPWRRSGCGRGTAWKEVVTECRAHWYLDIMLCIMRACAAMETLKLLEQCLLLHCWSK